MRNVIGLTPRDVIPRLAAAFEAHLTVREAFRTTFAALQGRAIGPLL